MKAKMLNLSLTPQIVQQLTDGVLLRASGGVTAATQGYNVAVGDKRLLAGPVFEDNIKLADIAAINIDFTEVLSGEDPIGRAYLHLIVSLDGTGDKIATLVAGENSLMTDLAAIAKDDKVWQSHELITTNYKPDDVEGEPGDPGEQCFPQSGEDAEFESIEDLLEHWPNACIVASTVEPDSQVLPKVLSLPGIMLDIAPLAGEGTDYDYAVLVKTITVDINDVEGNSIDLKKEFDFSL